MEETGAIILLLHFPVSFIIPFSFSCHDSHYQTLYSCYSLLKPDESSATNKIPKHQVHCTMHRIPHQRRKVSMFPALSPTIFSTIEPFPILPRSCLLSKQRLSWLSTTGRYSEESSRRRRKGAGKLEL